MTDIYASPRAVLEQDTLSHHARLQEAREGRAEFSATAVVEDALAHLSGTKRTLWAGVLTGWLCTYAVYVVATLALGPLLRLFDPSPSAFEATLAIMRSDTRAYIGGQLVSLLVLAPMLMGLVRIAVRRVGRKSATFLDVLCCFDRLPALLGLVAVIFGVCTVLLAPWLVLELRAGTSLRTMDVIGRVLLLAVPVTALLGLAGPLVVEYRLGVGQACLTALLAIRHYWARLLALLLLQVLSVLLCVALLLLGVAILVGVGLGKSWVGFPLGVVPLLGLFWLVPWIFLCFGATCVRLFGPGPEG